MSDNDLRIECDCKPIYLPFHERETNTFWSAYCPSCRLRLKWDINIKTKKQAMELWKKTFGENNDE
jgi:hypothetical protein